MFINIPEAIIELIQHVALLTTVVHFTDLWP